jgi:hypothetical protein
MRKIGFAVLLFFAATVARADSTNCFTPIAGFSYITSLPVCGAEPLITITPPPPIQNNNDQGENNDDQGETINTSLPVIQPGTSVIFGVSGPAAPVSAPEPSSLLLLFLGLAAVLMFKRTLHVTPLLSFSHRKS